MLKQFGCGTNALWVRKLRRFGCHVPSSLKADLRGRCKTNGVSALCNGIHEAALVLGTLYTFLHYVRAFMKQHWCLERFIRFCIM
jgi:hypothetical protein